MTDSYSTTRPGEDNQFSDSSMGPGSAASDDVIELGAPANMAGTTQSVDRSSIHLEMGVMTVDGDNIGSVKEIRATDFLLNQSMKRDVFVPFTLIRSVSSDNLFLSVTHVELDDMDLPRVPLMGEDDTGGDMVTTPLT